MEKDRAVNDFTKRECKTRTLFGQDVFILLESERTKYTLTGM